MGTWDIILDSLRRAMQSNGGWKLQPKDASKPRVDHATHAEASALWRERGSDLQNGVCKWQSHAGGGAANKKFVWCSSTAGEQEIANGLQANHDARIHGNR